VGSLKKDVINFGRRSELATEFGDQNGRLYFAQRCYADSYEHLHAEVTSYPAFPSVRLNRVTKIAGGRNWFAVSVVAKKRRASYQIR
jgi:hypothetical protein